MGWLLGCEKIPNPLQLQWSSVCVPCISGRKQGYVTGKRVRSKAATTYPPNKSDAGQANGKWRTKSTLFLIFLSMSLLFLPRMPLLEALARKPYLSNTH